MNSKVLLYISLFFLLSGNLTGQQKNHALLIGVGEYLDSDNWNKLSSVNDVNILGKALEMHGFNPENIHKLTNQKATKSGILNAIEMYLTKKVYPGDIVYFHFSGHGQQVKDDNGDEIDGLDEALVPYDSPQKYIKGINEGNLLLRDDELEKALFKIRKKLGPKGKLIVTIDACHSGTATRGLRTTRGTDIIMADSMYIRQRAINSLDTNSSISESTKENNSLAPLIALFSSSPHQLSYEYSDEKNEYGLFTFALVKSLEELSKHATFFDLLEKIKLKIRANTSQQIPQAEGKLSNMIFENGFKIAPKYFSVVETITSDMVLINAGKLQSISKGCQVAFYPNGTKDTSGIEPLALGIVDESGEFDADVILDSSVAKNQILSSTVYITKYNWGDLFVRIQLGLNNKVLKNKISSILSSYSYISIVDSLPDLYLESPMGLTGQNRIDLYQNDDTKLWSQKLNNDSIVFKNILLSKIRSYIKANYLRSLQIKNNKYKTTIKLFIKNKENKFVPIKNKSLIVGDIVKIKIENEGTQGIYFTVLDIQPDDKINKLYPNNKPIADFYLEKGKSFLSSEFIIEEPLGLEILKIISTKEPMQFDFTRSLNKLNSNPLEKLISLILYNSDLNRGQSNQIPTQVGFIDSFLIEIAK